MAKQDMRRAAIRRRTVGSEWPLAGARKQRKDVGGDRLAANTESIGCHALQAGADLARYPRAGVVAERDHDLDPLEAEHGKGVFGERQGTFARHPLTTVRWPYPVPKVGDAIVGIDTIQAGATDKRLLGQ